MLTMAIAPGARSSGSFSRDEAMHADALQPDRVEHAGRRLDDARRRVPFALVEEQALDRDAAERREIDGVGVLDAVAEAAARGDERVAQRAARRCGRRDPCDQCAERVPDDARWRRTPGPSMQERTKCGAPSGVARGHDAAVAAAHAAAHHLLERHVDGRPARGGERRRPRASSASARRHRVATGASAGAGAARARAAR